MYTWTVFKGSADGTIKESISTSGPLQDNQVLVAIVAAGLCGTDTHQRHSDMVLGHEGVGMVQEIGPNVRSLRSGDRVGWGYQHGCCHSCKHCLSGREMYCPDAQLHGVSDLDVGAFATHAIWTEPFLIRIPDGLSSIDAAPIMCAGITVYSALKSSSIPFGGSVGIIGMGGLGHLAIQFAAKQGCRVAVFSHNEEKRGDALDLGAHEFHVVDGTSPNKILSDGIDILLVTDSRGMDWPYLLQLMQPEGRIVLLSILFEDIKLPAFPLVTKGLHVDGSALASRQCFTETLQFVVRNHIKPIIQKFPLNTKGIAEAMTLLEQGKIKYRAVLVPEGSDIKEL